MSKFSNFLSRRKIIIFEAVEEKRSMDNKLSRMMRLENEQFEFNYYLWAKLRVSPIEWRSNSANTCFQKIQELNFVSLVPGKFLNA